LIPKSKSDDAEYGQFTARSAEAISLMAGIVAIAAGETFCPAVTKNSAVADKFR
jgi:hypothetical protein